MGTRAKLIDLLGILPEKVATDVTILAEVDCGAYTRRTVEYAVEANERIRAFLCVPKNLDCPAPGVYCLHQHGGNRLLGKSEVVGLAGDPEQAYAAELAAQGVVTLAADALCFEDRCQDRQAPEYAHVHELHARLLRGQTLLGKALHDVSAGIDLLQETPEVDPERIGFIGHSFGGRMALFAPVYDRRIRASVCSCGSSNYRDMPGIQFDFVLPGILQWGDIEDVVRLVEPAHLFVLGGEDDGRWSASIPELVEYARSAFIQGELAYGVYPGGHHFSAEMRAHAYAFLGRHLG